LFITLLLLLQFVAAAESKHERDSGTNAEPAARYGAEYGRTSAQKEADISKCSNGKKMRL
jgi:hypothetical protein